MGLALESQQKQDPSSLVQAQKQGQDEENASANVGAMSEPGEKMDEDVVGENESESEGEEERDGAVELVELREAVAVHHRGAPSCELVGQ